MGVSGSGKTTVGRLLAADLGWDFLDADDFHPEGNKKKMAAGVALTDGDRGPWLAALAAALRDYARSGRGTVLACSALKESYRRSLRVDPSVRFVYLKASLDTIGQRLATRRGHFFDAGLLASQFEALEEPRDALVVDVGGVPEATVEQVEKGLRIGPHAS